MLDWIQLIGILVISAFLLFEMSRRERESEERLRQIEDGLDKLHRRLQALEHEAG